MRRLLEREAVSEVNAGFSLIQMHLEDKAGDSQLSIVVGSEEEEIKDNKENFSSYFSGQIRLHSTYGEIVQSSENNSIVRDIIRH